MTTDRPEAYILKGHEPVPATVMQWMEWEKQGREADGTVPAAHRRVAETTINDYWVSTVFLAFDHGLSSMPILFETMVWSDTDGDEWDQYQDRYATWEQAEAGHAEVVAKLQESQDA